MTVSRRATMKAIGALGATTALTGTALAVGEHDDDERDPDETATDDEDVPEAIAAVRVAHLSPDAPAVDIYVDGDQVLEGVDYEEITPYLEIPPGSYQVTITAAGDPETVAFDDEVYFGEAFHTVAAVGELAEETFMPLVLTDAGSALIRLGHASPDAPAVDVVGNEGSMTLFENVSFGTATNYVALPAGSYTLDVLPAAGGEGDAGGEAPDHEEMNGEGDGDADTDDDYDEDEDNGVEDADDEAAPGDAVATVEVDLEMGTAYSAFAAGYLEGDEPDREFTVVLTEDGPGAVSTPDDADDEMDADEEPDDEMDEEDHDDEAEDDDYDDEAEDDDKAEDDDYDDEAEDDDKAEDDDYDDKAEDDDYDDKAEDDDYDDNGH
ncbi:DUF4397 domain-containing protein [Halobacteria archaeon AArc-dxtr1]|nr:DUF4397 domain-containing protein [Halobacteria archaeon AArc-dxtr1]